MRIRVVEDMVQLAVMLKAQLEYDTDWVVTTTTDEFARLLRPEPWEGIDMALVDLQLPEVSGVDILAYLRDDHPHIKRIAMSASLPMATEVRGLAPVLVKPFRTADIVEAAE